jgi:hypothetical protein
MATLLLPPQFLVCCIDRLNPQPTAAFRGARMYVGYRSAMMAMPASIGLMPLLM